MPMQDPPPLQTLVSFAGTPKQTNMEQSGPVTPFLQSHTSGEAHFP
jgi:hypothetical protein